MIEKITYGELVSMAALSREDTCAEILKDKVLSKVWEKKKVTLYDLLGKNLIIEKPITIHNNDDILKQFLLRSPNWQHLRSIFLSKSQQLDMATPQWELTKIFSLDNFVQNRINDDCTLSFTDGFVFQIKAGERPFRALGRLFDKRGWSKTLLEATRLDVSMILQKKKVEGTLCLSIHPLDFATMSENTYNWRSCMNWEDGEYKMGTIDMMNSPIVLVAYIKGKDILRLDGDDWNSKKWRTLCIVHPNLITTIKGYPYESTEADKAIVSWVRELAVKNLGWSQFIDQPIEWGNLSYPISQRPWRYNFTSCGSMYIDFCSGNLSTTFCISKEKPSFKIHDNTVYINYGGGDQCLKCGKTSYDAEFYSSNSLLCNECGGEECQNCGAMYPEDEMYYIDGIGYCIDCFEKIGVEIFNGHDFLRENVYSAILIDKNGKKIGYVFIPNEECCLETFNNDEGEICVTTATIVEKINYNPYIIYYDDPSDERSHYHLRPLKNL